MYNNKKLRFVPSDSSFNIKELYMDGSQVTLDDWKQTILIDEKPISIPGSNAFVMLPSEIGLPSPSYFVSYPYTGESLFEEYQASYYLATGWSVSLGKPGISPAHLDSTGGLIVAPLSGRLYGRPLNSNTKTTITNFYIDSGINSYFNFGQIPETAISGNQIIGWDLFYSLSGAEDLSVTLHGRYNDLYQENVSDGVIMTSGDAAVSFFLEYGALTGDGVLEYYTANEFIATRWGIYAGTPGTSTLSLNPIVTQYPLSGRFYYRDPKDNVKTTISHFSLNTGSIANWQTIVPDFYIPFRKIIGLDIYYGLNDLKNLHIILGGQGIASANYFKSVVTKQIFDIFSGGIETRFGQFSTGTVGDFGAFTGFVTASVSNLSGLVTGFSGQSVANFDYLSGYLTGLIQASSAGVTSLNGSYGAIGLNGLSGIEISAQGYPEQNITVKYTSGNFNSIDLSPNIDNDIPYKEGRLYYSADTKTFNAYLDKPDVTLNIGQEEYVRAVNKTNSTLINGTVVYISGAQGSRPQVWPAIATNDYHTSHILGITTHQALNNDEVLVTTFGSVGGINTSAYAVGDILYLSHTTAGAITNIPPTNKRIKIGYVLNSANNGRILVIKPEEEIDNYTTIRNLTILRYI